MKITKRKDGRFGCQIRTPDGKYKTVYGKTAKECRQKAYDLVAQLEDGTYVKTDKTLLKNWVETWKDGYLIGIKDTTKRGYVSHLKNHIVPDIGDIPIQNIEPSDIQKFCTKLYKDKELSQKMVRNIHGTLHKCLDDAVSAKLIRINPASGISLPKKIKPSIKPLTEEMMPSFYKECEGNIYGRLYRFLILSGLRIRELTGLTFDRVDFENKSILIDRQLVTHNPVKFGSLKHDKVRTVPLSETAIKIIKNEKVKQSKAKLLTGDPHYNSANLVFCKEGGDPIDAMMVYNNLKIITKTIGCLSLEFTICVTPMPFYRCRQGSILKPCRRI